MHEEDELAFEDSVSLDMLTGRPWVIFERRMHPPVYDAVLRLAEQRKAAPTRLHHIMVPEDAYSLIVDEGAAAFVVKSGAIRIAHDGVAVLAFFAVHRSTQKLTNAITTSINNHGKNTRSFVWQTIRMLKCIRLKESDGSHLVSGDLTSQCAAPEWR